MFEHVIWRLTEDDAEAAGDVLARAFHDEPIFIWAVADPEARMRLVRALFPASLRHACRYGEALAVGTSQDEIVGVVYWVLRPEPVLTQAESDEIGYSAIGSEWGPILERLEKLEGEAVRSIPGMDGPWRYLAGIGVDPGHQGQGFGSTLTRRFVADSFAAGLPCGLVTNRERNLEFYARQGFEIVADQVIDGLRAWSMLARPGWG